MGDLDDDDGATADVDELGARPVTLLYGLSTTTPFRREEESNELESALPGACRGGGCDCGC